MHLVDSHCHLDFFDHETILHLIERAKEVNIGEMVTIGTRLSKAEQQKQLTDYTTDQVKLWCTVGTHPEYATEEPLITADKIASLTHHPKVIGIGETGLDYFYGKHEDFDVQKKQFRAHIQASQLTQLPLCIHAREADDDIITILHEETEKGGYFPFLIHCFTSGLPLAQAALELGGYISISGIVTFKKAQALQDIVTQLPQDRILVETDAPYLAPVPHRGKQNEPSFVAHTARFVAQLKEMEFSAFTAQTTENFHRLFKKAH